MEYVSGSIQSRGLPTTLRLVASELLFDVRQGVDTIAMVELDELHDVPGPDRNTGNRYQGGNPFLFGRLFGELRRHHGYNFKKESFFDFGCGKGRAMLMALGLGFREVGGVEWSPTLAGICSRNLEKFRRHHPECGSAHVLCANAADIAIPDDATVLFYFNPFKASMLDAVLTNVRKSRYRNPRRITHVYLNPVDRIVFTRPGFTKLFSFSTTGGGHEDGAVYVE